MKILVTGATGFIGSHLTIELMNRGHCVYGSRRDGSMPKLKNKKNPSWIKPIDKLEIDDLQGIDAIIHLASAGVSPQKASWAELTETNISMSIKLIDLANKAGVKRFVATGTCLEYGSEAERWEKIPPNASLRPATPYAASKASSFFMLNNYAKQNSMELYYGRIFSAYGEGQYEKNLWPSLCNAAKNGEDFPMTNGLQIRDFIPVDLVAKHLSIGAERKDINESEPLVVNIGSGKGRSVIKFAESEWRKMEARGKIRPGVIQTGEVQIKRIVADTINLTPEEQRTEQ